MMTRTRTHTRTHGLGRAAAPSVVALALVLCGCGSVAGVGDTPLPAEGAADAYWALQLSDHAINLSVAAPTNTMQLEATPMTADGRPVPGVTATPTYTVQDTTAVIVSSAGVLTARKAASKVRVVATWAYGGITHVDTAVVRVTTTAPSAPLATFSIQPAPGDSAKWSYRFIIDFFFPKQIVPVALDATGQPINGLLVAYGSSQRRVAIVTPNGSVQAGPLPGTTLLSASTYAYGVRKTDSLPFVIGLPTWGDVTLGTESQLPGDVGIRATELTVGVGAVIGFKNCTAQPVAIIFDNSTAVTAPLNGALPFLGTEGGNIAPLDPNCSGSAFRGFGQPGTYQYRDGAGHVLGRIIVQSD